MANVTGPVSSTDTAIALWNGTSGAVIQDSGVTVDSFGSITTTGSVTANTVITDILTVNNSAAFKIADISTAHYLTFVTDTHGSNQQLYLSVHGNRTIDLVDDFTVDGNNNFSGINTGDQTDATLPFTDITTNNVSSTKRGFAPKSPADATKFLNGATTPAYAQVKDSDLSLSDITTNNASTSNHGFLKKLDNTATHYMDGTGNWSTPAGTTTAHPTYQMVGGGGHLGSGFPTGGIAALRPPVAT
jgi:hypothetical protein